MYIKSHTKVWSLSSLLILYLSSITRAQNGCDLVCIAGGTDYCNPLISNCPPCVGQRGENWYCSEPKSEGQCEELDFTFCPRDSESPSPTNTPNAPTNAPTTTSKRTPAPTTTKRSSLRPTGNPSSDSSSNGDVNSPIEEGDSSSSSSNSSTQKPSSSSSGSGSNAEVVDVPKTTKKKTTITLPPLDTSDTSTVDIPTTISPSPTADDTKINTESESSAISTPIIVGFIGAGIVLLVGFALCCWKLQQDDEESEDEEDHQWNNNPQVMSAQKSTPLQYKQQQFAEDQPYGNFHSQFSQSDGSGYSVDPYSEKFSGYYTGPVASQSPVPAAPATIASDYGYHSKTSDISADNNRLAPYSSQRYQRSRSGFNQQNMRAPSNISVEF